MLQSAQRPPGDTTAVPRGCPLGEEGGSGSNSILDAVRLKLGRSVVACYPRIYPTVTPEVNGTDRPCLDRSSTDFAGITGLNGTSRNRAEDRVVEVEGVEPSSKRVTEKALHV